MKIKFDEIKNELFRHCIIHCVSKMKKELGDEFIKDVHTNDGNMELKLFADIGDDVIELPLESWFGRLEENYNDTIKEKAEEIVRMKFFDIEDKFDDIINDVKEKLNDDIRNYINESLDI